MTVGEPKGKRTTIATPQSQADTLVQDRKFYHSLLRRAAGPHMSAKTLHLSGHLMIAAGRVHGFELPPR